MRTRLSIDVVVADDVVAVEVVATAEEEFDLVAEEEGIVVEEALA